MTPPEIDREEARGAVDFDLYDHLSPVEPDPSPADLADFTNWRWGA